MSTYSKGYVAVFDAPLTRERVEACFTSWQARFERIEQMRSSGDNSGLLAFEIHHLSELHWEKHLQFRILSGEDFAWVYLTMEKRVMETTGMPHPEAMLCLDLLLELPGVIEVIDQQNDRRLDELETTGLM